MPSGWNSIPGFARSKDPSESQESIGITQFDATDETRWFQIIGGLIMQGGTISGAGAVEFPAPYEKQVLGVWINNGTASGVSLAGFTASGGNYWFSIGL